jgi:hypothetical protein
MLKRIFFACSRKGLIEYTKIMRKFAQTLQVKNLSRICKGMTKKGKTSHKNCKNAKFVETYENFNNILAKFSYL